MIQVRAFERADFPAVQRIYQQGIDTGHATFQQAVKPYEEWDHSVLQHCRLVAEQSQQVCAWAALSSVSNRCVYEGIAEVSVYVATEATGQGIGSTLLQHVVKASEAAGIWTLQAGIFPENKASIAIHSNNGFRQVGVRERLGVLKGQWRGVVLMGMRSSIVGLD